MVETYCPVIVNAEAKVVSPGNNARESWLNAALVKLWSCIVMLYRTIPPRRVYFSSMVASQMKTRTSTRLGKMLTVTLTRARLSSTAPTTNPTAAPVLERTNSRDPGRYHAVRINKDGTKSEVFLSKMELLSDGGIHMRDMLPLGLDVPFRLRHSNRLPPQLHRRGNSILVLMGPYKALILHDHAFFFSSDRSSVQMSLARLIGELRSRAEAFPTVEQGTLTFAPLVQPTTAFELFVIDHILEDICSAYQVDGLIQNLFLPSYRQNSSSSQFFMFFFHQRRMRLFQPLVSSLLMGMTHGSEGEALERLHRLVPIKTGINNFQMVVGEAITCLERLLADDEDLVGLLLSERKLRLVDAFIKPRAL